MKGVSEKGLKAKHHHPWSRVLVIEDWLMVHLGVLYDAATSAPKRQISIHNGVKDFQEQILSEPGLGCKGQGFRSSSIQFKHLYSMASLRQRDRAKTFDL